MKPDIEKRLGHVQDRLLRLGDDVRALLYIGRGIAAGDGEQDMLNGLMIGHIAQRFRKKINRTYGDVDLIMGSPNMSDKMAEAFARRRAAWEALNTKTRDTEGPDDPLSVEFEAANEAMRAVPIKTGRDATAALSVALEEIRTFRGGPETVDERLIKNVIKFLGGSAHG